MGRRVVPVGEAGLGSAWKLVNSLLGAVAMSAFAKAATPGQAAGIAIPCGVRFAQRDQRDDFVDELAHVLSPSPLGDQS